jgi:chromate transporter
MKFLVLYWYLTQATVSSFTGLSTLPIVQHEFVEKRHWITDQQLNNAILIGRSTPGPMGVYVVSVGQMCGGPAGALAGWLALMTPALSIIALLRGLGNRTEDPRFKNAIRFIVLAANGYALATLYSLSRAALSNATLAAIGISSAALLLKTKIDTLWILLAAGILWVLLA